MWAVLNLGGAPFFNAQRPIRSNQRVLLELHPAPRPAPPRPVAGTMDGPSLLCVVVDCDKESWTTRNNACGENQINFNEVVSNVVLFCSSFAVMHRQNRLAVIACGNQMPGGFSVVYPRRRLAGRGGGEEADGREPTDDFVPLAHLLPHILSVGLLATQSQPEGRDRRRDGGSASSPSYISQALLTALCIINRQVLPTPGLQPRILVSQLSRDHAPSYNNVMNSIFSADKLGVPIDALVLRTAEDSHFLQQACYMTRGIYQRPVDQRDVLQLLIGHCLPSTSTRQLLNAPFQKVVEFKASCFCHKKAVEFAYMCSVCLALTCKKTEACETCGTPTSSSSS